MWDELMAAARLVFCASPCLSQFQLSCDSGAAASCSRLHAPSRSTVDQVMTDN
jgi:hypothetical protein